VSRARSDHLVQQWRRKVQLSANRSTPAKKFHQKSRRASSMVRSGARNSRSASAWSYLHVSTNFPQAKSKETMSSTMS